jgi:hypothetical protein
LNAAIKIQEVCNAVKDFQLRIGIHLGEVVFENDDVFGDGVNIASRIQAIAKPGCIYVSESVHNNISNKKDITTKFIKEETLKNVKDAVRMYEVMITNNVNLPSENKMKNVSQNSIAVLPFANMSSDPEQEFFSDGISEEIRFIDPDTVLVNEYPKNKTYEDFAYSLRWSLRNAGLHYVEFPYNSWQNEDENDATGCYINFLEIGNYIFYPVFADHSDQMALIKLKKVFKDRQIIDIDCRDLAKLGGILNCATWNIKR